MNGSKILHGHNVTAKQSNTHDQNNIFAIFRYNLKHKMLDDENTHARIDLTVVFTDYGYSYGCWIKSNIL